MAEWCDFGINKLLTFASPEYLQEHHQEIADYVTLSNDEDGIAEALYHYFPEVFK